MIMTRLSPTWPGSNLRRRLGSDSSVYPRPPRRCPVSDWLRRQGSWLKADVSREAGRGALEGVERGLAFQHKAHPLLPSGAS